MVSAIDRFLRNSSEEDGSRTPLRFAQLGSLGSQSSSCQLLAPPFLWDSLFLFFFTGHHRERLHRPFPEPKPATCQFLSLRRASRFFRLRTGAKRKKTPISPMECRARS